MYELIILTILMRASAHGYLIAKVLNDVIGPLAKLSHGTLYPLLTKLEQTGFISAESSDSVKKRTDRQARTFVLTDAGRQRFHQLMMDTSSNPGEYQKFFRIKVPYLEFLQPSERLHILNHYIMYCQTHVLYLRSEAGDLSGENAAHSFMSAVQLSSTLEVMQHMADQWQAEEGWAKHLREQEVARAESDQASSIDVTP